MLKPYNVDRRVGALLFFLSWAMFVLADDAVAQEAWDEKFFNPKKAGSDLVLPLPCGGAMAFAQVAVASESLMQDVAVSLGSGDPSSAYGEGTRVEFLSFPFSDPGDQARRFFYIAKYELSADQAAAIKGECPAKPSMKGRIPALGLGWFDAVALANQYTEWLIANHADQLPTEGESISYVRLPTETEWEFAARGGLAVSPSEFTGDLFPTPEGEDQYIWHSSTSSANGKPRPTGLKEANPLGLYDIIGNAEEIVLDSYRLVHFKRLHGMTGAYQVKGGSYLTDLNSMRSSYRQEISHFDAKGPRRVPTVGTRFAISMPIISSRQRLTEIREEWAGTLPTLGEENDDPDQSGPQLAARSDNPITELEALSAGVQSDEVRERLYDLSSQVRALFDGLERQQKVAVRSLLKQGGAWEVKLEQDAQIIARFDETIQRLEKSGATASQLRRMLTAQEERRDKHTKNVGQYAELVTTTGEAFGPSIIRVEKLNLATEYRERGIPEVNAYVDTFVEELDAFRRSGGLDFDQFAARFLP